MDSDDELMIQAIVEDEAKCSSHPWRFDIWEEEAKEPAANGGPLHALRRLFCR
jgi:hypothetical protein